MSFQEFERKYSYLLSWEDAEKKGRTQVRLE